MDPCEEKEKEAVPVGKSGAFACIYRSKFFFVLRTLSGGRRLCQPPGGDGDRWEQRFLGMREGYLFKQRAACVQLSSETDPADPDGGDLLRFPMEAMEEGNGRGGGWKRRECETVPQYVYLACDDSGNQCVDSAFLWVLSVGYCGGFPEQCQRFFSLFFASAGVLDLSDNMVCGSRAGSGANLEGS